jgi:hypothetical protein
MDEPISSVPDIPFLKTINKQRTWLMQQYLILTFLMLTVLLHSCFKDDERALPYPGEIFTVSDSVQKHQSYFDFETGRVVSTHLLNAWQLGFECRKDGWRIITNSGDGWFIFNTGFQTPQTDLQMPDGVRGLYDIPHAWPDSTAVGNWVSFDEASASYTHDVYLLGKNSGGAYSELKQLIFLGVSDTGYTFSCTEQPGGFTDTLLIVKDTTVNFVYFSFRSRQQVNLEPAKTDYDIVFTSYYDMATNFGITMPYLVGGAMINVWQTSVAFDSLYDYGSITLGTIPDFNFNKQRDIPGYRWKTVTVDVSGGGAATYAVKSHYHFIFRTAENSYAKMRFLSYSLDGRSGYPRFEYQLLE